MTRKEAIFYFEKWMERDSKMDNVDRLENIEIYKRAIKALEQEPRKGHWVDDEVDSFSKSFGYKKFHCSRCLKVIEGIKVGKTDFCPNCGADMRGEEE